MYTMIVRLAVAASALAAAAMPLQARGQVAVEELKATAEEAYLYGFPMIVGYDVMNKFFIDRDSGQFKAPINTLSNEARVFTPKDTAISTPNSDTPYSMAMLDLRAEPMVLCMPEIEKARYYDVQLVDLYTNNYGYIGSRATGNGAGCYLVSGPEWQGEKPPGIARVIPQRDAVQPRHLPHAALQPCRHGQCQEGPGGLQAAAAVGVPRQARAARRTGDRLAEIDAGDVHDRLRRVSRLSAAVQLRRSVPPRSKSRCARSSPRSASARTGSAQPKTPSPEVKAAIGEGVKAAFAKIGAAAEGVGTTVNGWQIGSAAGSREFYKGNWALRAAAAKLGIYGNSEAEAVYPFTRSDANGIVLDGSKHTYQMTFAPGQLPPVNAFWSITMYDGRTQLLIDNPINRYLVNSPMLPDLKKNPDGSLTLFIQRDSPGKDKESNWLPAPDGPMFVVMRLYWPKTDAPSVYPLGKGSLETAGHRAGAQPQRAGRDALR